MNMTQNNAEWSPDLINGSYIIVDETTGLTDETFEAGELADIVDRNGVYREDYWRTSDRSTLEYFQRKYQDSPKKQSKLANNIMVTKFAGRRHTFDGLLHRVAVTPSYLGEYLSRGTGYSTMGLSGLDGLLIANESANTCFVPLGYPAAGVYDHIADVVNEIFDGRNDLGDVDKQHILDRQSAMAEIIGNLFINRPGENGGISSLRHIFKGDRNGGLHVPAFAEELAGLADVQGHDIWSPFEAIISINGVTKLKIVEESSGAKRLEPAKTSMFPIGMDSMSVLQSIIEAWSHRRDSSTYLTDQTELSRIYELPFNVGAHVEQHTIRIVTDATNGTEKIRTAFPVIK